MDNKKIVLPKLRFKGSEESDINLKVNMGQETRHIIEGDRTVLLDQSQQYDKERQDSNKYRLTAVMRPIFKNLTDVLTSNIDILSEMFFNSEKVDYVINNTSANTPDDLNLNQLAGKLSYDEFDLFRKDYNGSSDPNSFGLYNNGNGFGVVNADRINWNMYLTYPSKKVNAFRKSFKVDTFDGESGIDFDLVNGLPFRAYDRGSYYEIYSPFPHGLTEDGFVKIGNHTYNVDEVGNEKYRSEENWFIINKGQLPNGITLGDGDFKRVAEKNNVNETTSEYFVLEHTVLKTPKDFTINKNAFESSIFEDEKKLPKYFVSNDPSSTNYGVASYNSDGKVVTQELGDTYLVILEDEVDVEGLKDHLDRPILSLYFTNLFKNTMGMFSRQQFCYKEQLGLGNEDINTDVDISLYDTTTDKVVRDYQVGDTIYGGIYEYNPYDLEERLVSERKNRLKYSDDLFFIDEGPNYTYDIHHEFKINQLSDYVEESETSNIFNLPTYSNYVEKEKKWIWRDIWTKGYVNPDGLGVDYPFINGCHYINKHLNLYIKPDTIDGVTNDRNKVTGINSFIIDNCG